MRHVLVFAILASLAGCASKKAAARTPNPIGNSQPDTKADDDKPPPMKGDSPTDDPKPPPAPGSDPCEGGEYHPK